MWMAVFCNCNVKAIRSQNLGLEKKLLLFSFILYWIAGGIHIYLLYLCIFVCFLDFCCGGGRGDLYIFLGLLELVFASDLTWCDVGEVFWHDVPALPCVGQKRKKTMTEKRNKYFRSGYYQSNFIGTRELPPYGHCYSISSHLLRVGWYDIPIPHFSEVLGGLTWAALGCGFCVENWISEPAEINPGEVWSNGLLA